jgi:hypothetical protein
MSGGVGNVAKAGGTRNMSSDSGKIDSNKKQYQSHFKYKEVYNKWIADRNSVARQDIIEALKFFLSSPMPKNRAKALKHLRELKKEEEIENSKESLKDHDIS